MKILKLPHKVEEVNCMQHTDTQEVVFVVTVRMIMVRTRKIELNVD